MLRNLTITLLLSLGLVACGGGKKPAAQGPVDEEKSDDSLDEIGDSDMPVENEHCCCDYVADPSEDADDMAEEHTLADMSMGECDEAGGVCTEDSNACYE
jgi:hypothetical protein